MDSINLLIAAVIIFPLMYFFFRKPRAAAGGQVAPMGDGQPNDPSDGMADLDAAFMARAEAGGEASADAIAVMSLSDLFMVRSLLAAAGIANFAKNDHMSSLIPGINLDGLNPKTITVFQSDVQAAEEIYDAYLAGRRSPAPDGPAGGDT